MGGPSLPPMPPLPPPPPDATDTAIRQAQEQRRRKALSTMGRMSQYLKGPTASPSAAQGTKPLMGQ